MRNNQGSETASTGGELMTSRKHQAQAMGTMKKTHGGKQKHRDHRAFYALAIMLLTGFLIACDPPGNPPGNETPDPMPRGTVATPTFSIDDMPVTGGIVRNNKTLTITAATGATISYTIDEGEATVTTSNRADISLASPFELGVHTFRAIAQMSGFNDSEPAIATFIVAAVGDVDVDDNGLIEIFNLDMLDNIRHNFAGTSYDDEADDGAGNLGSTTGAPATPPSNCASRNPATNLCGYELMQDLDFTVAAHYAEGVVNRTWRPVGDDPDAFRTVGFNGFGADSGITGGFTAIFEGNGHSIANFYSRSTASTGKNVGLFRLLSTPAHIRLASPAHIRNVGLTGVHVYGGEGVDNIGGLVGYIRNGTITASHVSGNVHGGAGNDSIGGLVGYNEGGTISASHASGSVHGGGENDVVGGLLGYSAGGSITASHASGSVHGGAGGDSVGGLVGWDSGTIRASYATGHPDGGVGSDNVGGLIGLGLTSTISASYASGNPNGGAEDDNVGGLVGQKGSGLTITASYATGHPDGGDGDMDRVGELTGRLYGTVTASYAFGTVSNNDVTTSAAGDPSSGTDYPSGVSSAAALKGDSTEPATYAGASWDSESDGTKGAWNFGTDTQDPALVYADYDGSGGTDYCSTFPATVPETTIPLVCGTTLLGGQGR